MRNVCIGDFHKRFIGTTKCKSLVRLADGTTWHNSIVVDWFMLLKKQILGFLWGGYSILIGLADSFILFVHVLPRHYIVPCQAHRNGGLCHGTNSHNLVPTTLGTVAKS